MKIYFTIWKINVFTKFIYNLVGYDRQRWNWLFSTQSTVTVDVFSSIVKEKQLWGYNDFKIKNALNINIQQFVLQRKQFSKQPCLFRVHTTWKFWLICPSTNCCFLILRIKTWHIDFTITHIDIPVCDINICNCCIAPVLIFFYIVKIFLYIL